VLSNLESGDKLPSIKVQGNELILSCPECGEKRSIKSPEAEMVWGMLLKRSHLFFNPSHHKVDLSFSNIPTFG